MRTTRIRLSRRAGWATLAVLVLPLCACRRADTEPSPQPLSRKTSESMEVLERVRQKRAPGQEITRIAEAIEAYQVRYGILPARVEELVDAGLLPAMPKPPEGMLYVIDPLKGNVELLREADVLLRQRLPDSSAPQVQR